MSPRPLKALFVLAAGTALWLPAGVAHAQVYKCTGADGSVTYTNDRSIGRNCSALKMDLPVSSIPAVRPRSTGGGGGNRASTPARSSSSGARASSSSSGGGGGSFPNVSSDTQRARDNTRQQILQSELATEQKALDEAKKALTEQEALRMGNERNYQKVLDRLEPYKNAVELHQRNIDALQRELGRSR